MKKLKNKSWLDWHAKEVGEKKAYRRGRYRNVQISPVGPRRYIVDESGRALYQSLDIKKQLGKHISKGQFLTMPAPSNFSLYLNPDETLEYISKVQRTVLGGMPVYIAMEPITVLSMDTIMYFLAILKKLNLSGVIYRCGGSLPHNEECKHLLQASGFLSFVHSRDKHADLTHESDIVRINRGERADPKTVKHICNFVMSNLNLTRLEIDDLYIMIMELMSNTRQHAYINKYQLLITEWYIFVYYVKEKNAVRFIFLDTGMGIPSTIRKRFLEPAKTIMGFNSHTDYIKSALDGKTYLRSRTGESYRGNGLPTINSFFQQGYIKDLTIISNRGYFSNSRQNDLDLGLDGTLFYWEFSRGQLYEQN